MKVTFTFMSGVSTACIMALAGCGAGSTKPDAGSDGFDRSALLGSLGEVTLAMHRDFATQAGGLAAAVEALCPAIGSGDEGARVEAARTAWREAMVGWQALEMAQIGPLTLQSRAPRDAIYAWPFTSACAVDQEVMVRHANPSTYDVEAALVNRRGLGALEHLLFDADLVPSCATAPAGWDVLLDSDKRGARCGLAAAVSADLVTRAEALVDAWDPSGENYLATLREADGFPSAQEAVNHVSDALFYLDKGTKEKIAKPAGITANTCGLMGNVCLADLESFEAAHGKQNVLANLRAFDRLYRGGDGIGFDDFLRARGGESVAAALETAIPAAIAEVEAIPGTLESAITDAPEAVASAHSAVKVVTDLLKSEFLTTLALDIPDSAAGDND